FVLLVTSVFTYYQVYLLVVPSFDPKIPYSPRTLSRLKKVTGPTDAHGPNLASLASTRRRLASCPTTTLLSVVSGPIEAPVAIVVVPCSWVFGLRVTS